MFKKQFNHVVFEVEENPDVLTYYVELLQNKYHLRTVFVSTNSKIWKLTVEGSDRAWRNFVSSKTSKFIMDKSDIDGRYVFTMKYL